MVSNLPILTHSGLKNIQFERSKNKALYPEEDSSIFRVGIFSLVNLITSFYYNTSNSPCDEVCSFVHYHCKSIIQAQAYYLWQSQLITFWTTV